LATEDLEVEGVEKSVQIMAALGDQSPLKLS
jgi:hypothetical protein